VDLEQAFREAGLIHPAACHEVLSLLLSLSLALAGTLTEPSPIFRLSFTIFLFHLRPMCHIKLSEGSQVASADFFVMCCGSG
jgi:hypothetical protein